MFMSNGPSIPSGDYAILCNYDAALHYLTERGTRSHQFGRQQGWIELLRNGDSFEDGRIGIRYHNTHVITLHSNGDTTFDTGGWNTISTQEWMRCSPKFDVNLYVPRHGGPRKPYRYSMIRFAGHDRNIERQLREEWGMPNIDVLPHIWEDSFRRPCVVADGDRYEHVRDEDGRAQYYLTDPTLHERAQYFQGELCRRQIARHPYYVFKDGITFTARGRCLNSHLLSEELARERKERAEAVAARRKVYGRIRAYTNRTMKALAEGLPLDDSAIPNDRSELRAIVERAEPNAALTVRIAGSLGDVRDWLNFQERGGEIVLGEPFPVLKPIIREKIAQRLKSELITT